MIDEVLEMRSLAVAAGRKPTSFHDAEGANDNLVELSKNWAFRFVSGPLNL
jgi:hypothetical protein